MPANVDVAGAKLVERELPRTDEPVSSDEPGTPELSLYTLATRLSVGEFTFLQSAVVEVIRQVLETVKLCAATVALVPPVIEVKSF